MASPEKKQPQHPFKHLLAGGIAGATEAFILYPTEYVKTQLQLQGKASTHSSTATRFSGPWDCVVKTVRGRGVTGLYQGMNVLVTGTFVKAAIRFYSFNHYSRLLASSSSDPSAKLPPFRLMLAGLGAGMTEAVFAVTPMETIKTKLIHDRNSPTPQYRGMIHGVRTMVAQDGMRGLYQGLVPTMMRQGANSAIRFTVFQNMQAFWNGGSSSSSSGKVSAGKSFLSGAMAGIWATVLTMPIDVVKTRMQGMDAHKYRNSLDCLRTVFRQEGLMALWKGTTPRLSRVMFSSGIVFAVQDFLMRRVFS